MAEYDQRCKRNAVAAREARAERLSRMWARYLRLSGQKDPGHLSNRSKWGCLKACAAGVPGWWFANALEAADLDMSEAFQPAEPEPTGLPPGTLAKIQVLTARAEAGQKLFTPADSGFGRLDHWEGLPG